MGDQDFHTKALDFIYAHIPSWSSTSKENTTIRQFTGNSNKVFLVETSLSIVPNKIVYRVFGPNDVTDKNKERKIFSKLAEHQLAPLNYGNSSTERLEYFLEGYNPIENRLFFEDYYIAQIIRNLKELHSFDMSDILNPEVVETDQCMSKWKKIILSKLEEMRKYEDVKEIEEMLSDETIEIYNKVLPRSSPLVFSHLDPSCLNVLVHSESRNVYLIDFEFSGYSYRAMDLALILNEAQIDFMYDQPPYFRVNFDLAPTDEIIKKYTIEYGGGKEFWIELKRILAVGHLIWAYWSATMYDGPTAGYDYFAYSVLRYKMFKNDYQAYCEAGGLEYLEKQADILFSS